MPKRTYNRFLIWTIRVFLCAALILILGSYHPKYLFVDWSNTKTLPLDVTDRIEIGSDRLLFKRASLSLLCSQNRIRILLRSNLQMPSWIILKEQIPSVLLINTKQKISTAGTRVNKAIVDSVLTEPLNSEQLKILIQGIDNKNEFNKLSFFISESSVYLNAMVKSENISSFTENCANQKNLK